jgi:hypothetical protein
MVEDNNAQPCWPSRTSGEELLMNPFTASKIEELRKEVFAESKTENPAA